MTEEKTNPNQRVINAKANAVIPTTVFGMNTKVYPMYGKLEQHLRNHSTVLPRITPITWEILAAHNPHFSDIQKEIVNDVDRGISVVDEIWNNIANKFVQFVDEQLCEV